MSRSGALAELSRRTRQVVLLATLTGVVTGAVVACFDRVTADVLLEAVLAAPPAVQVAAPGIGLAVAVAVLRGRRRPLTPATSDAYIQAFHDPTGRLPLRPVARRMLAALVTLGSGSPLGYEGPSLYAGAAVGSAVQRRWMRLFGPEEGRTLLVAGAAAGVAAIFKAPVTGLVFALEVPYQEDLARRMLLPAGISAASSYVVFAAVAGTKPLLPVAGQPPFNLVDLGGAAVVGLLCGVLARLFVTLVVAAKRRSARTRPGVSVASAAVVLGATVVLGRALGASYLVLGPGYHALDWALDPHRAVLAVLALGALRAVGTAAVVGGGGTGGLFIPLVIEGALVGRAVGGWFDSGSSTLFPVLGMAAFLGAGYRVPLAAVVFVAEFTGRPGFVVPGLIAAIVAQLVMGRASISPYQVSGRVGHLESRLRLPLAVALDAEARTVPPDATVEELFWQHLVATRQRSAAVVDGSRLYGVVSLDDLAAIDRAAWASTPVSAVVRTDVPVADPSWSLRDAMRAMEGAGLDRLAVCDDQGGFAGVVTAAGLVQLDALLERSQGE